MTLTAGTDFEPTAAADDAAGRCASCGSPLHGRYCHVCGERTVTPDDMRVRTFTADALQGAFDLDSRLWRTLRALVFKPGELTAEHMRGRRRPYLGPLQVFLLANLLFFAALTTVGGFNTFTTTLFNHVERSGYGDFASQLVERRAPADSPARQEYERRFNEATTRYANSMVILLAPLVAGLLYVLYFGRRFFVQHLVFVLHFLAWLLLLLMVMSLLVQLLFAVLPRVVSDETAITIYTMLDGDELLLGLVFMFTIIWYVVRALQRTYADRIIPALVRGVALVALILPLLTVYRFILFLVVYSRLG